MWVSSIVKLLSSSGHQTPVCQGLRVHLGETYHSGLEINTDLLLDWMSIKCFLISNPLIRSSSMKVNLATVKEEIRYLVPMNKIDCTYSMLGSATVDALPMVL